MSENGNRYEGVEHLSSAVTLLRSSCEAGFASSDDEEGNKPMLAGDLKNCF